MDPQPCASTPRLASFPRTRGDGPVVDAASPDGIAFPPHSRGWTHCRQAYNGAYGVSPALAGMDLVLTWAGSGRRSFPRTRGDGPTGHPLPCRPPRFPPHSRGWTLPPNRPDQDLRVSPALAGMDPTARHIGGWIDGFPRTRGDGPDPANTGDEVRMFPPHSRGWTRDLLRGADRVRVSPALAGMDPSGLWWCSTRASFPRTRGDGPHVCPLPARKQEFPPHSRGWTRRRPTAELQRAVSPALAGMDPGSAPPRLLSVSFPRTRGDGPSAPYARLDLSEFPPHSRGWTWQPSPLDRPNEVSPALAGMDPTWNCGRAPRPSFPRTRGDGPARGVAV